MAIKEPTTEMKATNGLKKIAQVAARDKPMVLQSTSFFFPVRKRVVIIYICVPKSRHNLHTRTYFVSSTRQISGRAEMKIKENKSNSHVKRIYTTIKSAPPHTQKKLNELTKKHLNAMKKTHKPPIVESSNKNKLPHKVTAKK